MNNLLLAYYGDDFTGSTDALEFLSRAGVKTVLFIEPPTADQLQKYEDLQAFGVAGMTRSLPPDEMEKVLRPAFEKLKRTGAKHVHYKVCSTFDSSPHIGSIGKAIDTGAAVFESEFIPVLVAAPALGRYTAFGNLFARMGIGSQGQIYRLDRHPSMSKHPVTPADESDLRLHLAKQTSKQIGLVDIVQMNALETAEKMLQNEIEKGAQIVFLDALYDSHISIAGALIDEYVANNKTVFSVGSSGVEMALGAHWKTKNIIEHSPEWKGAEATEKLLVISGSCSPVTEKQIAFAAANNFALVALDTEAIAADEQTFDASTCIAEVVTHLQNGKSVIVHSSLGATDERIEKSDTILQQRFGNANLIRTQTAKLYGTALGQIAREVVAQTDVQRIVIAGGDTSSFAARAMGIEAVEMIAALTPGAPLCKAYALSALNGCEVVFKGGQVGGEDYFVKVLKGG
jgi:3-oxoisoapionate kinase